LVLLVNAALSVAPGTPPSNQLRVGEVAVGVVDPGGRGGGGRLAQSEGQGQNGQQRSSHEETRRKVFMAGGWVLGFGDLLADSA